LEPSKISKTLLKVAIGFGAFSVIGIVALTIAAVVWFRSITSPAHVKSVAETFMTIADPLPKGFRYTAAYEVSGLPKKGRFFRKNLPFSGNALTHLKTHH
jgi:hypothetical protein